MFGHELIRQTLLSDVSAAERERLHLRIAEAISRLYSDDLEAYAGELAYHLSHAGAPGIAPAWFTTWRSPVNGRSTPRHSTTLSATSRRRCR